MCFIVERLRAALFSPVPNAVGFADKTMVYAPSHTQSGYIYHSLAKEAHERSTLQVRQRGGWALFRVLPHLTTKERPSHVYSDWMPSKQTIGQTITVSGATSGFEVES